MMTSESCKSNKNSKSSQLGGGGGDGGRRRAARVPFATRRELNDATKLVDGKETAKTGTAVEAKQNSSIEAIQREEGRGSKKRSSGGCP